MTDHPPAAQPAAVRRPPDRHDHNQEDPMTTPDFDPIQRYALSLVADGAESITEDDLHEDPDDALSDEDHEAAVQLAMAVIRGMRANPTVMLALADPDPEAMREAASRLLTAANEAEAGR